MRVLVAGGGGREHALVRALRRSARAPEVLAAPGNAGIARDARIVEVAAEDVEGLVRAARDEGVDLVVVGPEAPLVAGAVDALAQAGIAAFGPGAGAARLEGSKAFAKEAMEAAGVPTAAAAVVDDVEAGMAAIEDYPAVLKADGLAAGKGVVIAAGADEARAALEEMLVARRFGDTRVLVEEHLEGEELCCWPCATASARCRWRPRRTTSASSTATRAPTPAGWAPTRPFRAWTARAWRRSPPPSTSRWSTSCASAARRFTASCTPG